MGYHVGVESQRAQPDSTGKAAVDPGYFWRRIDGTTPVGVKVQLVRKSEGVATYGFHTKNNLWFTHWAPLPKFRD